MINNCLTLPGEYFKQNLFEAVFEGMLQIHEKIKLYSQEVFICLHEKQNKIKLKHLVAIINFQESQMWHKLRAIKYNNLDAEVLFDRKLQQISSSKEYDKKRMLKIIQKQKQIFERIDNLVFGILQLIEITRQAINKK